MGGAIKSAGSVLGSGVTAFTNSPIGDTLFGAKSPDQAANLVNTNSAEGQAASKSALGAYSTQVGNLDQTVSANIAGQEDQLRQNSADQAMKAQDLVAQHGLGDSSLGLSTVLNQSRGLGDQIGQVRAGANMMKSNLLNSSTQGISGLMGAQSNGMVYNKAVQGGVRRGGIMEPITSIGGMMAKGGA
jgi:hypothetical protein